MRLSAQEVTLSTGAVLPLSDLAKSHPLALIFLRHLGCPFCRRQVAQLRRKADLNVAFVTMATAEESEEFRLKYRSPHPFISDPQRRLYEGFGLRRAPLRDVIGARVVMQGLPALRYGMSRPRQDPLQLGGTFILDTSGDIAWSHPSANAADYVKPDTLEEKLIGAAKTAVGGKDDPSGLEPVATS